ncbi:MAG: 30S ribosomal protein S17 [Candidatus ainarchaeum sp.]|nr:30S ribosomal protein S17 [Candidatus ainarchaeum sp.]
MVDEKSGGKSIRTRGAVMEGRVVKDRAKKTVIVQRDLVRPVPKYERSIRVRSKVPAHNPDGIGAKAGDWVQIEECRKLSKTKAWVVTKVLRKAGE